MRKGDVLAWGVQHIAGNYQMGSSIDYEDDGQMCIYVTEEHPRLTPAPQMDVLIMCQDLGIPADYIETSEWGIDICIDWQWAQDGGLLQQDYQPTGFEMWVRQGHTIGS